jgi:hypothetical protein
LRQPLFARAGCSNESLNQIGFLVSGASLGRFAFASFAARRFRFFADFVFGFGL